MCVREKRNCTTFKKVYKNQCFVQKCKNLYVYFSICVSVCVFEYLSTFGLFVKVRWGSRSNVWHVAVYIRGSAFRVQQTAITLNFGAKDDNYQSEELVRLCKGF